MAINTPEFAARVLAPVSVCSVERTGSQQDGRAFLVRCDQDEALCSFPGYWTDEQIMKALDFANASYRAGFTAGERAKIDDILVALRLPRPTA
jgi:hypothetical protein